MVDELDCAARSGKSVSPWRRRMLPPPPLWGRSARSAGRGTLHSTALRRLNSQHLLQDPLRLAPLATSRTKRAFTPALDGLSGKGGARSVGMTRTLRRSVLLDGHCNHMRLPYLIGDVAARSTAGGGLSVEEAQRPSARNRLGDDLLTPCAIAQHIIVPEPQNLEALSFEPIRAFRVVGEARRFVVLSAIDFDKKLAAEPSEIGHIESDRSLTAKWNSVVAKWPQQSPHPTFRVGLTAAQTLGERSCARVDVGVGHRAHHSMRSVRRDPLPPRYARRPPPQGGRGSSRRRHGLTHPSERAARSILSAICDSPTLSGEG
jgi:hypothetical protein